MSTNDLNESGQSGKAERISLTVTDVAGAADETSPDAEDLAGLPSGLPAIPRSSAVKRLAEALLNQGMSEGAARAIARVVVRPEEARRRLQNPDLMRVPGGVLETLSIQVWTPGISPYPGNNREASQRVYPLSGVLEGGQYPPLGPTSASPGATGELVLSAINRAHVVSGFDRSSAILAQQNDLSPTIGEHGILRELMLSVVRVDHDDRTPPTWIMAADDGSSRTTGAHRNLGLGAEQVVYQFPADDRAYRGFLGGVLADAQSSAEELTSKDVARARSLVAPATLILRFLPDPGSELSYDQAVRFIVGITHVEPPQRWSSASENDALGDAVIEEFLTTRRVSQAQAQWFAATLNPAEAVSQGFGRDADTRVAEIAGRFLSNSAHQGVRRGILRITAKGRVTADFKAKIITEMMLRPWRSAQPDPEPVNAVRSTIQRLLAWPVLKEDGWRRGTDDPDKLLAEALEQLGGGKSSGPAGVELGLRAGYYLAIQRRLQRERVGGVDYRAPSSVLQRMTETEHGLRVLHAAIVSGREGRPAVRVDAHGAPERNEDHQVLLAEDPWIRRVFPAADATPPAEPIEGLVDTPESRFERERQQVAQLVESLDSAVRSASAIKGQVRPLVRERGWPYQHAENLADRLTEMANKFRLWAAIAQSVEEAEVYRADQSDTDNEAVGAPPNA